MIGNIEVNGVPCTQKMQMKQCLPLQKKRWQLSVLGLAEPWPVQASQLAWVALQAPQVPWSAENCQCLLAAGGSFGRLVGSPHSSGTGPGLARFGAGPGLASFGSGAGKPGLASFAGFPNFVLWQQWM